MNAHSALRRLGLALIGLTVAVLVAELTLRAAGLPRFGRRHDPPVQFAFLDASADGVPVYVNVPSTTILFAYEDNPRGYFGASNAVKHVTNAAGFRGAEFRKDKPAGVVRLAFLGDSFTFGEGVHYRDSYAEAAARLLAEQHGGGLRFESYNFGVGGYNTRQSLYALRRWALQCQPDIVVLGYVLNDAEPPLFSLEPATRAPVRRDRESEVPGDSSVPAPPTTALFRLRVVRVGWKYVQHRRRARATFRYYRALYGVGQPGWRDTTRALHELGAVCAANNIPFYVVCFPVFVHADTYPFGDIHGKIRRAVDASGGRFVELLPAMSGTKLSRYWVHPSDQHPNEVAHSIAARLLARRIAEDRVVESLRHQP